MAAGLIVKTTTSTASSGLVRAAGRALPSGIDVARVRKSASGGRTSVLSTSERVTAADAEAVAAELRDRADVVWAAPNYILRSSATPPVPATDPYFVEDKARAVWDWRPKTDSKVRSVLGSSNTFGNGGFSSRAPYAWRATKGEGAVVAVLDTGITVHPDLPGWNGTATPDHWGRILPGYDFVSQRTFEDGYVENTGRDDDGWDDNPQDRGDWTPGDDYCFAGEPMYYSSWHGTHVSGIIAAAKDNDGMVGVAPEVKILPVRVLGLCGGTTDDIVAGMRWSVGLPVTDPLTEELVPGNTNPADVLNMSLGEYGSCLSSNPNTKPLRDAIADVHGTDAVIVASAGNGGVNLSTYPFLPASCEDVVAVGATSEYGDRAGYRNYKGTKSVYSNYGSAIDLVAPGGDVYWSSYGGILSSINDGLRPPGAPTYARYSGTSMAAPVVSAAAALLKSVDDDLTADQTVAALRASVQSFPRGTHSQFRPCTTSICGKGIIDLSKIQAPSSPTTIVGQPIIGEPLTAARGTWSRIPTSFTYQWFKDGSPIPSATSATYIPTQDDSGALISVRMSPSTAVYSTFGSTSEPTDAVPDGPEVTMSPLPTTRRYGQAATTTVALEAGAEDGVVELRRGSTVLASGTTVEGSVTLTVPGTGWVIGSNNVRAAYLGEGATSPASSIGTPVSVTKAISVVSTTLPTSVRYTSRATIGITVAVDGVPAPTGQLRIYDGSKKIVYAVLASSAGGKRSIVLPRLSKGYHYIKVVYSGSSVISGDTSTTLRIKSY